LNGVTVLLDFGVIQMSSYRVRALGSVDCCGKSYLSVSWLGIKDVQVRTAERLCAEEDDVLMHKLV